jgi:very-short-patch-repair endonuclease
VPPKDEFVVLDADASQSYAINAAVGGADLVIDGPPGTGKSQTIANLIATLAARGQRILFVAEKRAAIDAVLDRLNRVGLGELVLDLHEGPGPKRRLAADLARALHAAGAVPRPDMGAAQEALVHRRDVLVGHADALHLPRDPWAMSVYDTHARLLGIPAAAVSAQRLRGETLTRIDGAGFRKAHEDLEAFAGLGGLTVSAETSPWGGAVAASSIPSSAAAQQALDSVATLADHTLPETAARLGRLLAECGLATPATIGAWAQVLQLLDEVAAILDLFEPGVFSLPLDKLSAALVPADKGPFARIGATIGNGAYRKARSAALEYWKGDKPKVHDLHAGVERAAAVLAAWRHVAVDRSGAPCLPAHLAAAHGAYGQLSVELGSLGTWTARPDVTGWTIPQLHGFLQTLRADTLTLYKLPDLIGLRSRLLGAGLGPLLSEMRERSLTVDQALACLEHVWLSSILETVSVSDPRIGAFDGGVHSRTVAEYRTADHAHIESAALRVRRAVAEHATNVRDEFPKESDVIEHQARLKRGHLPVRSLFQAAPHVLGALKPCWAMSPLVVSQMLPASPIFDVVIFDEASQVTPADAVGALMRADRAVVAGDPHQLPPTSFFAASSGGGEDDEDVEEEIFSPAGTKGMESVLDVMTALLPPPIGTRTLGWHYRSRDERLIAFSNAQRNLYDWSLTTFPGVGGGDCISHELVLFRPGRVGQEDSVTDEVGRVVELVAEHAATRPYESLGVIAMGIKHANRIDEVLRRARTANPTLDAFLSGRASPQALKEPFFVKNLERVQGDERDAIILTIGYGKSTDGRMLYRFGPINNDGGHRRLNVAITRARAQMTVVSSFSSMDMDPNRLSSDGAQMLCRYLAYAESGGADLGNAAKSKPELNPFERDIAAQLTAAGIPLVAQYGCSGYWIDYAAQHPNRPGQMVLAIECDGATYHSSATARDRDRLRQEHLERLGWRFHRIWSQDWFYRREAEVIRAVDAYRAAVKGVDAGQGGYKAPTRGAMPPVSSPARAPRHPPGASQFPLVGGASASDQATLEASANRSGTCPVQLARPNIGAYDEAELVSVIRWIESDTLLRTEEELLEETMRVLGFSRRGSRITEAITIAIARARDPSWPPPRLTLPSTGRRETDAPSSGRPGRRGRY